MAAAASSSPGAAILLEEVTKRYPGQPKPAVGGLTLEIPAGSVVMFVGPSGCGKTTTLKMINRLIEPTEGRIVINGEDVTTMDPDQLRRKIGYVIQAGGLFPHMSVAGNIAVVPKMLGWDKARIARRVDELLELVSLDPDTYRDRYPKELSGGQQQRVGVARALAADPPVLLMDEPFGAVDPITRQRLQDELLNIQAELGTTIVCVTHDFDEAMKLGDWIAVFDEGAQLVQYDSPERILAQPANEFVEGFIGSGAGLKQLSLSRVRDASLRQPVLGYVGELASDVLSQLQGAGSNHAVILDRRRRPIQWLTKRQLSRMQLITDQVDPELPVVGENATLNDALDEMLVATSGHAIVTGARGVFLGVIDIEVVTQAITDARSAAQESGAPVGLNSGAVPAVAVAAMDAQNDDAVPLDDGPVAPGAGRGPAGGEGPASERGERGEGGTR
ncbi:MAG: ATP-binding cassette domain-containing protein [Arthrobacter sp.]|nr:ATP-binding cassette domain-containing protein [Arthrobacter sp.]